MMTQPPTQADAMLPTCPEHPPIKRLLVVTLLIVLLFFGGLGSWAALSPLESAAIAPGRITVASNRKTVQHLEGGIVRDILVQEGDQVKAGQVIVHLEDTPAHASVDLLRSRQHHLLAKQARLLAERDGRSHIAFPEPLTSRQQQPEVKGIVAGEISIFKARKRSLGSGLNIRSVSKLWRLALAKSSRRRPTATSPGRRVRNPLQNET